MIKRLLIANRGAIAARIAKTTKKMGIKSIAVFSDADKNAYHTRCCDEQVYIGPSNSKESYLNIGNIIKAARENKADAIHPGYGFLSENSSFSEECRKQKIIFIGPSSEIIKSMGIKTKARNQVKNLGINILDGFSASNLNFEQISTKSEYIGYPIMLKASHGGGGRGMRKVFNSLDLKKKFESAKRESKSAFGSDTMLIEKLIEKPRHIEVQIVSDNYGNTIHLFERDCSLQRNNQKVIEECPAINLKKNIKDSMYQAAVKIARSINYTGVGTVEFLVNKNKEYFFIEMNTRLQVEHGITEEITGIDLVKLQIEIASGLKLKIRQEDVSIQGHAMEARLYAEDPENKYTPSPGKIKKLDLYRKSNVRIFTL